MVTAQILAARQENQTWDEAFELASGYAYLETGVLRINFEQPPLGKLIAALAARAVHPSARTDTPSGRLRRKSSTGVNFFITIAY